MALLSFDFEVSWRASLPAGQAADSRLFGTLGQLMSRDACPRPQQTRDSDRETFFDPGSMTDPWRAISWKGRELCCRRSGDSSCWQCREWETFGTRMGMLEASGIRTATRVRMWETCGILTASQAPNSRGIVSGRTDSRPVLPYFASLFRVR